MTTSRDYRSEARAARQAARQTLIAYREARRRSRPTKESDGGEHAGAKGTPGVDETLIAPESFFKMPSPNPRPDPDVAPGPEGAEVAPAPEEIGSIATPGAEDDAVEQAADESDTGMFQDAIVSGDTAPPPDAASDDLPSEVSPDAETLDTDARDAGEAMPSIDAETDLFDLPGAGAGMIWMFHQCGINSLSDLARADQRELSLKLGVVGHILNIEPWIAFARERQGAAG